MEIPASITCGDFAFCKISFIKAKIFSKRSAFSFLHWYSFQVLVFYPVKIFL